MLKDSFEETVSNVIPVVDRGLGNSSYVVDLGDGGALVIDPERDPRPYLREMEDRSLKARFVVETHIHADFVSGAQELMASGAELWEPAGSGLTLPHRSLHDHEEVDLGGLTLRVIATPGHTPEHVSYLLLEGSHPVALFSGGTLMAGGAARTDLISPEETEPLARATYRSIVDRLFELPDDLAVYPTHGGGSFCSVASGGGHFTTIGQEKQSNPLVADMPDEDTFVKRLLAGYGSYPPFFLELRAINREKIKTFGASAPLLTQLSVPDFRDAMVAGGVVVDVRGIRSFADGHIPGAVSNPWRPQFAVWLGWLLPRDTPVLFVADESVDSEDLAWAALTVGFEDLAGRLDGGMAAWSAAGEQVEHIRLTDSGPAGRQVVDVRQTSEYATGHIEAALHIELGDLTLSTGGIPSEPVLVHCGHGERAMTAASLLARAGHRDVAVFEGAPARLGPLVTTAKR